MTSSASRIEVPAGKPARLPALRPPLALLRATGVFGKDLVRHAGVAVLMFPVSVLCLFGVAAFGTVPMTERTVSLAPTVFLGFLATTAYLLGLAISGEETESGTYRILEALPVSRSHHLIRKLAAAVVLTLAWTLAAGLTLGWIGGQGPALLSVVGESMPQRSLLNYGSSLAVTAAQTLSLILTGLVAGTLWRNPATGAAVGISAWLAYSVLVSNTVGRAGPNSSDLGVLTALTLWSVLMIMAYPRTFARVDSSGRGHAEEQRDAPAGAGRSAWRRHLRLHEPYWDPPQRYLLRVPLTISVGAVLLAFFLVPDGVEPHAFVLVSILACFLGTGAWLPEEFSGSRHMVYALPVSRSALYWSRTGALLRSGVILSIATFVGWVWIAGLTAERSMPLWQLLAVALVLITPAVMVFIQAGSLFRLFFRSALLAGVLAVTLGWCWSIASAIMVLKADDPVARILPLSPFSMAIQIVWSASLPLVLVVGTSWIAFCRSRLLELPDRTRAALGLLVFLLLLVWGGLLITMSPPHIISIISGGRIFP